MKIWYRCKCCEKKIIIVEKLDRGEKWSYHDWDDLNDFINCLQEQVFKLDGGSFLAVDPDEFEDNLTPKYVFNNLIVNGHTVPDEFGNPVKVMEALDRPRDNWPQEFIARWVPEKSEAGKEYEKWRKEMEKKGEDLNKFYELMKQNKKPVQVLSEWQYFYKFTADKQGSIIIDPKKSDKYLGNEINKIDYDDFGEQLLNDKIKDPIEEGKEYVISYKDSNQLRYEYKSAVLSDLSISQGILWIKGDYKITLNKGKEKPNQQPNPIPTSNEIIEITNPHAVFEPPPHQIPKPINWNADNMGETLTTIIFTPNGYQEQGNSWLIECKVFSFSGKHISKVELPKDDLLEELIITLSMASEREFELKGMLVKVEASKLTFSSVDYIIKNKLGTFDEFFDEREGKQHNSTYPDQLRHDIKEYKLISGLGENEAKLFKGTPIMEGRIILYNFPKLESFDMAKHTKISQNGNLIKLLDFSKNAYNLKKIIVRQCEELKVLALGEKRKLERLDCRWTSLKHLDLSRTNILRGDYDTPKLPVRMNGLGETGDFIFPFTEFKEEMGDTSFFYKKKFSSLFQGKQSYIFKILWPKKGERKTIQGWRDAGKINDHDWNKAQNSGQDWEALYLLEEAKKFIDEALWY